MSHHPPKMIAALTPKEPTGSFFVGRKGVKSYVR